MTQNTSYPRPGYQVPQLNVGAAPSIARSVIPLMAQRGVPPNTSMPMLPGSFSVPRQPALPPARVPDMLTQKPAIIPMTNPRYGHTPALTPPMTRQSEPTLLPIPNFNPYSLLKNETIDLIARERDIMLQGNRDSKIAMLHELDNIFPEWLNEMRSKNNITFRQLTGIKLLYFAAFNGLNMTKMSLTNSSDILVFIEISLLARTGINKDVLRSIVLNTNRHILEAIVVYMGLEHKLSSLVPLAQLRSAVIYNDIKHINQEQLKALLVRRTFLSTHKYVQQLALLYGGNNWDQIAMLPVHPMEKVIIELDSHTDNDILITFGIAVPLSYAGRIRTYILENIVSYTSVLARKGLTIVPLANLLFMSHTKLQQYFSELLDTEIFVNYGAYVPYNSRAELISNITNLVLESKFFTPCPPSKELSVNKSTTISETEFDETDQFFLAYGKIGGYYTYEITELIGAFHRNEGGVINFRRPQNTTLTFTLEEVKGLDKLLKCFNPSPNITELLSRIALGISEFEERTTTDALFVTEFGRFSDSDKQHIRKFLHDIFYIGMYMRRWKGPPHPYPTKQEDTLVKEDPNDFVTELLKTTKYYLDGISKAVLSFCMRLKVCEYQNNHIECGNKEFITEWRDVLNAKRCIRQASTMYIGTAYHYLVVLFHERIPNLDVKTVAAIM